MANAFLDPTGDGSPLQWTPSTGITHYNLIAKGVHGATPTAAPASNPSTGTYVSIDRDAGLYTEVYTFNNAPAVQSPVSSITVWIYGLNDVNGDPVNISLTQGGSFLSPVMMPIINENGWNSATFAPAGGFSQADLDALQLEITTLGFGGDDLEKVYAAFVAFSYSAAVPPATPMLSGFGFTNNGVPGNSLSWV